MDTNIVSAISRPGSSALPDARQYLQVHRRFTISLITRYEVLRGLEARGATVRVRSFESFCALNEVLPIDDRVIVQAARIYAVLHRCGELIGDADTLIAATALVYGLAIVTNNERHFARIRDLHVINWL